MKQQHNNLNSNSSTVVNWTRPLLNKFKMAYALAADEGKDVFIFEDNTLQPFTSIGADTILWSGNHIGHHSKIGNHCFISSHVVISGSCTIGNNVFIGVNSTLRDGIHIADESLIGAGSIIMKDTRPKEVYMAERTRPFHLNSEDVGF